MVSQYNGQWQCSEQYLEAGQYIVVGQCVVAGRYAETMQSII